MEGSILRNGVLTKLAQRYLDWVKRGANASFVGLWQGMGGLWSTKVTNSCIPFYLPNSAVPPPLSPLVSPGRFFLLNCIFLSTIIGPSLVYDDTKFANVKWVPREFFPKVPLASTKKKGWRRPQTFVVECWVSVRVLSIAINDCTSTFTILCQWSIWIGPPFCFFFILI